MNAEERYKAEAHLLTQERDAVEAELERLREIQKQDMLGVLEMKAELERLREQGGLLTEQVMHMDNEQARLRCIEEAARAYLDTPMVSSDTSMRQYNPRLRDALRAALEEKP